MGTLSCVDCKTVFKTSNALYCHRYRESNKIPEERCGVKEENKRRKQELLLTTKDGKTTACRTKQQRHFHCV